MRFPVHAITLDLDDTIWPIGPVIVRAETALGEWLREHAPRTAEHWPLEAMRALRDEVAAEHPQLAHDFTQQRLITLERMLRRRRRRHRAWSRRRSMRSSPRAATCTHYDDSLDALDRLAARVPLAALSNGNADLQRIGLMHVFRFQLGAREHGAAKPAPSIFLAACRAAGLRAGAGAARRRRRRDGRRRRRAAPACAPAGSTVRTSRRRPRMAARRPAPRPRIHHPRPRSPTGWTRHTPRTPPPHEPARWALPPPPPTPCRCTWSPAPRSPTGARRRRPRSARGWTRRGSTAAPGTALALAGRRRPPRRRGARRRRSARSLLLRPRAVRAAAAHRGAWPATHDAADARRAAPGLGPGQLPLQPLQAAAARCRRSCWSRTTRARHVRPARRLRARARPGQHPDRAHGPGPARAGRLRDWPSATARTIEVVSGDDLLTRNFPAIHAVGRASHRAPRLIALQLGRRRAPARRDRRQGRVLRHRRPRPQARRRHAQHEEGHGRRRARDRAGRTGDGARAAAADHAAGAGGRECDRPERVPPRRSDRHRARA